MDSRGNFYFSGRKDSLIIKGGENIYPAEIENALYKLKMYKNVQSLVFQTKILVKTYVHLLKQTIRQIFK